MGVCGSATDFGLIGFVPFRGGTRRGLHATWLEISSAKL